MQIDFKSISLQLFHYTSQADARQHSHPLALRAFFLMHANINLAIIEAFLAMELILRNFDADRQETAKECSEISLHAKG